MSPRIWLSVVSISASLLVYQKSALAEVQKFTAAEQAYLTTCSAIRSGNVFGNLSENEFPEALIHLRPRTEAGVECVPVFLNFFSSRSPSAREWHIGRALLWNLVEESATRYGLADSYRQLSIRSLDVYLREKPESQFRY